MPVLYRVCWNEDEWKKPSGVSREGKYVTVDGFGHEEWNFQLRDAMDRFVYAYVRRPPGKDKIKKSGNRFIVGFYARTPRNTYEIIGIYEDARVPSKSDHAKLFQHFENEGIFQRRSEEVERLSGPLNYESVLSNLRKAVRKEEYVLKCPIDKVHLLTETVDVTHLVPERPRFMNPTYPRKMPWYGDFEHLVDEEDLDAAEIDLSEGIDDTPVTEMQKYLTDRDKRTGKPPRTEERTSRSYLIDVKQSVYLKKLANDTCQICSVTKSMKHGFFCDVHHVTPLSKGGLDSPSNIIVVCPNCHRIIHRGKIREDARSRTHIVFAVEGIMKKVTFIGLQ